MPIYTRTGDKGTTALFGGKRVLKCHELVDVYGSIDELNSWVGLVASQLDIPDVRDFLSSIQADLFIIGGHLAGWQTDLSPIEGRVGQMEKNIDDMEKTLPPLKNFILPGGSALGATVHLARGVCRRVERQAVSLDQKQPVDAEIMKYLNRLSDFLFMLARFINKQQGAVEVIWQGIDRKAQKK
jgi:cob(I)alamin adenosyltransferase